MRSAVLAASFAVFCNAFAQDDAVVVEATRFPEEVRRLPASVSVITGDDISRSAARTLPELLNEQVGFTMKDFYGNNAAITSMDLRGFGITGPQNTLILLDGRRLNDFDLSGVQWSAIPLASIERIEVLRGTGAVLYGDAASAGVVNIVTRSPLKEGPSAAVLGRIASFHTREGQLYGRYAAGDLGLNATLYGFRSDGYRANNRNEQQNSAFNLRWAIGDGALDFRFGTDRQDLRLPGGRLVQPSIGLDESADPRGTSTPLDYASRDGTRAGATFLQRFGGAEFSIGVDHRGKEQRSFFDFSGFPAFRADDLDLTSLTPRVKFPISNHTVLAGVDWHHWRYRSRRTDRPENVERPTNRVAVTQRTQGFYLQDTIELTKATLATLGWRSERARYTGDDTADATAPACFFCAAAPSVRETQKEHAWELGLRHQLSPLFALYGRAGRSFRFVNAEEIYENDAFFTPQFQILRPQHARTHEGGVEWRRAANSARVALFRTDVSNEIHLDPFTTGVGNTNLPPSRRQGIELDWKLQVAPTLRLSGGYAYTDAKFREGVLAGSPFAIGTNLPVGGKTVPLVPRHKVNLALAWDVAARTRFSSAVTAVSEQVLDNDEPNTLGHRIPGYSVVDLKLAQKFGWGSVAAAVNNLFDKGYYTYAVRSAFIPDRYSVYPLPGRSFSLTAELALN
ncbi:MAG TPA: TonB-dependent receptor [Burkholderiales bacterium]|nr:TonB-dependent receptor [Burkholderiales bacterium]